MQEQLRADVEKMVEASPIYSSLDDLLSKQDPEYAAALAGAMGYPWNGISQLPDRPPDPGTGRTEH